MQMKTEIPIINPEALIVDDEPDIRELIMLTLEQMGVHCAMAANVETAKALLAQKPFAFCLTDMRLPDGNGIDLVKHIQLNYTEVPVAVITAYGNMELAINALKAGAFDFVSKPVNLHILRDLVTTALKLSKLTQKDSLFKPLQLLGTSEAVSTLRSMINKLARSQAPVLITGPSGSGKELVARLIHQQGPRKENAFIPVNCGAIPNELMESEFFGYKKGSFTGAISDKQGLFQAAHKGTLFLDEVAELPLHMQVKLLRAIQEKAILPIGMQQEINVDVRILSATHKELPLLIEKGLFRQDLYYRLNVIQLNVPSLKERPEDILLLSEHILEKLANELGRDKIDISKEAVKQLMQYDFPGNVRELENILERAATLIEGSMIQVTDLQFPKNTSTGMDLMQEEKEPLLSYLDSIEKEMITTALNKNRWNKVETAKQLGLTLRALRYRIKKLKVDKK